MTVKHFGRITPLQGKVLNLAGIVGGVPEDLTTEELILEYMAKGLNSLRARTGKDFGYDLLAWHDFLQSSEDHSEEYTFDYAWGAVREKVKGLVADPNRIRLVSLLEG